MMIRFKLMFHGKRMMEKIIVFSFLRFFKSSYKILVGALSSYQ